MSVKVLCEGEGKERSAAGLDGNVTGGGGNWERFKDPSVIPVA